MIYTALAALVIAGIIWYLEFRAYSIPVLYYHHVEPTDPITPQVFEAQMRYLAGKGYHSVSLNELYGFMTGSSRVPRKSFVLTFDDGFYCNYRYLFPILKKYGLRATVFAVSGTRKQSTDVPQRERARGYPSRSGANIESAENFATWDELKTMVGSGLVQVEDHSLFHDRVYIDDRAAGFNTGVELDWPVWGDKRPGTVRYRTGSSIAHRNFTGDYRLNEHLLKLVKGKSLDLSEEGSIRLLEQAYKEYKSQYSVKAIYESWDSYARRCRADLDRSRHLISEHTGVAPGFLCFPWGQYDKKTIMLLKELGYRGAVTTDKGANRKGGDPYRIKRFKVYRPGMTWFKRYFLLHRSRVLVTLYGLIYGWL
ncbi:MAG: polysaccharide deacetylase family protein [Deltaproteobacteria bacterium]|nr:polysaccharide deacetylase family protein [Deltaproteobacteria bacterium]MCL5277167.1 polysaccharide deacetylase family protein [Deltaproteobacteria bacterium]